ncbi:30S ribosomal protein S16 [Candidatus Falkowbacteria bacterium]|uniref:30S ribosomal protein S16 n=1 Tax=Candidatus Falkowbacteria bacterium CG10_big_fil_rev_8_21_14_0_10_37_18 TaxID=1974562 RepID=A0A2H0V8G2_9BACT|nr:30S ribosomal protein S16 [Candidatus Falkowbacteria bacterium]NCQ12994.1 30S ribosomal protein S16 [Candidatus Falkowbacteria bacterium]PIR95362.1 MAG: 30S ribosomal protein S16 [Candidatus Falkowbacteria bacterium CG10_big_fil_rev_8_21_14_0_10_37_18]
MLIVKLAQTGKTNKKMFRLIISEKSRDPYGNVLEILGSYNPHSKDLAVKDERIKYWLSKGAQMTATVNNLLVEKKVIEGKKVTASKAGKPSAKRQEQIKVKADKKTATETAVAPAAEAPVETTEEKTEEKVAETPEETTEEKTVEAPATETESPKEEAVA